MSRYSGLASIENAFARAMRRSSSALMPYFTLGYPSFSESIEIIKAIAPYSDLIELGVPFSDPIADGPTIQQSTQTSLGQGMTTAKCLAAVEQLRNSGITIPLLLMGYYNPILAYGEADFVNDCAQVGVDGLIVPDLPPEECDSLLNFVQKNSLSLIQFLAPTSNESRTTLALKKSSGFIYMVSLTGVTGARENVSRELQGFVKAIRERTSLPIAVGFGIGTPDQAAEVGAFADGVIVGSALIEAVNQGEDNIRAAANKVQSLRAALKN